MSIAYCKRKLGRRSRNVVKPAIYFIKCSKLISEQDEALVLENKVLALNPPTTRTLRAFKWWYNPGVSRGVPVLWGKDENLFQDERDFVALAPAETDRLNIFLQTHFGWFFKVSIQ